MKQEPGVCEECGRRTAVIYAHANLCEWCWPACALPKNVGGADRPVAAFGKPETLAAPRREARDPVCGDCGAQLAGPRRIRCLDCEVNRVFDVLEEKIEARRRLNQVASSMGGSTS